MGKIKLSDSDKRLLVIFVAIVMVACSYFFVFTKMMSKAADVEASNEKDRATVAEMERMEANLPKVRENMERLKQRQADIIAKYPSDLTTEKVISILESIEENNDYHISNVSFVMLNPVVTETAPAAETADTAESADETADTAENAEEAEGTGDDVAADTGADSTQSSASTSVRGYYAAITVSYDATYIGLKSMIEYVNEYPDRMTIVSSSCSFDNETGRITGDMTINMYFLTGTDKEYIEPEFEGVPRGVLNIFGGSTGAQGNE